MRVRFRVCRCCLVNPYSTFLRYFSQRCLQFSEFQNRTSNHRTWFGIVNFSNHGLCPFGDHLPDGGATSWNTSKEINISICVIFSNMKFYFIRLSMESNGQLMCCSTAFTWKQSILQLCTDCRQASTGFFALHDLIYV